MGNMLRKCTKSPAWVTGLAGTLALWMCACLVEPYAADDLERDGSWQFRDRVGIPVAEPLVLLDRVVADLVDIAPALAARGARGVICQPGDPLPSTPGDRVALRDLRDRLDTMGLRHLFFRLSFPPADATGLRGLDLFMGRVESLARTARWCEARGLWLDLPVTTSLFYLDHPLPEQELVRVGRRVYATIARWFPDADLLVYGGQESAPGPRWRALVEGLVEGSGIAESPRVTIVRAVDPVPAAPEDVTMTLGGVARMVAGSFSLSNRERWERLGGVAALLDMKRYQALPEVSDDVLRAFRVARDFAIAVSDRWAVFLPENPTGAVPPDGPSLRLLSPLRGLRRLGTLDNDPRAPGQAIRVFEREGRVALLLPEGLTSSLEIPGKYWICASVSLAEGTRAFHLGRNGSVVIPPHPGPLLITGLPGDADLARAGWSWAVDPLLESGPRRLNFMASWTNRGPLTRQGDLAAVAAPRWSLGAASMPFRAAPGETVSLRRTLQGVARPGERFSAQLLLQEPGQPPVSRTVSVPVFPRQLWSIALDGPCLPDRVLLDAESLDTLRVVAAAERSGPACFDADGTVLWNSMDPGPWLCGPVVVRQENQHLIAMGNRQGEIVFLDARAGRGVGRVSLDGTPARALVAVGESLAIALTDRGTCYGLDGTRKLWAVEPEMNVSRICPERAGNTVLVCGTTGPRGEALCVAPDGSMPWRVSLPGVPVAVVALDQGGWMLGLQDGGVTRLDTRGNLDILGSPLATPLKSLVPLPEVSPASDPGQRAPTNRLRLAVVARGELVTTDSLQDFRVALRPRALEQVWYEPDSGTLIAGAMDGTLYALDASGRLLWRDSRAWGAPRWVFARPAGRDRLAVMAGFADGVIRAWDGGPAPSRK